MAKADTPKVKTKTLEERAQDFEKEYEALCNKYGLQHGYQPGWRFSEDGNDYRLQIRRVVVVKRS